MAKPAQRVERHVKSNKGRIVMLERQIARLERRLEKLELERTATPRAANVEKLTEKVDKNRTDIRTNAQHIQELSVLREPVQALVRSFKQTRGAPFEMWCKWMLTTFRKYGVYRKKLFR